MVGEASAEFYHTCMDDPETDPEDCLDEYYIYLGWCTDCACLNCGEVWCDPPE